MCECSICYDAIDLKTTGEVKLSCSHSFHFSCISSWFFKQDKGTCPCCRKEMGEKEDLVIAPPVKEQEVSEESQEETISINKTELMTFLRRNEIDNPNISYEEWGAMEFVQELDNPEYRGESRLIFTYREFEYFLAYHSQKILGMDMLLWEDLLFLQETPYSGAYTSAELDFGMPLRLPSH